MNVPEITRDATARTECLRQYAAAYDEWADREQTYAIQGSEIESAGAHEVATYVLRAYRDELDDKRPEGLGT